jgi:tetratricopeptide (TPR) repeat protein
VLQTTRGYAAPEVEQAYARALTLCHESGDPAQQFAMLRGLWNCSLVQTMLQQAREMGEQLLALGHRALGTTWFWLGDFLRARLHLEHGIALATPAQPHALLVRYGEDPGLVCRLHESLTLWVLGYPDRAVQQMHEALRLTQRLAHPFSQAFALVYAAWLHRYRREPQLAQDRAERAMAVATEYGLAQWLALGTIVRGWALAAQGQGAGAIGQIEQGLATLRATGAGGTGAAAMAAETYGWGGRLSRGLRCWPRHWRVSGARANGMGRPSCIGSRGHCCCSPVRRVAPRRGVIHAPRRRKAVGTRRSPARASNRRRRGSCRSR